MEKYNLLWKYLFGESKIHWFDIADFPTWAINENGRFYEVARKWPDILAKTTRFYLLIFHFLNVSLYRNIFYTTVSIRIESNPC